MALLRSLKNQGAVQTIDMALLRSLKNQGAVQTIDMALLRSLKNQGAVQTIDMALLRSLEAGLELEASREQLLLFSIVGDEVKFGAGLRFEFGGAFCAGEIVTDAKGVGFDFVDAREGFAGVGSFGADDGHGFWLG